MNKRIIFTVISILFILVTGSKCFSAEVHLAWDKSSGTVTGYRIYYGTTSGNHPNRVEVGNKTDHILNGLDENVTYYFVARAYNEYGESGDSNEISWRYDSDPTPPPSTEEKIEAESGSLSSPMQTVSSSEASGQAYIQTDTRDTGRASYTVNIQTPASYKIIAKVYAADYGSNSFFVQVDDREEVLWDINNDDDPNEFNAWIEDEVKERGTGTYDNPQYDPYTIELSQGVHTISIRGREPNARLDYFYLSIADSAPSPPSSPTGITVEIK